MSDWKTIRVPESAHEDAKSQKEEHGRTWGEQIVRPDPDEDDNGETDANGASEYDRWQLETEHQQKLLEQHAKTQELLERLPTDIADELEGRMR